MVIPSVSAIDLGLFNPANVDRIEFDFHKWDGDSWEVWTGIDSVTLTFEKPDRGTVFTRSMILVNDSLGRWYYETAVTDFPDEDESYGYWTVTPRITDGAVIKDYPSEIGFYVGNQP